MSAGKLGSMTWFVVDTFLAPYCSDGDGIIRNPSWYFGLVQSGMVLTVSNGLASKTGVCLIHLMRHSPSNGNANRSAVSCLCFFATRGTTKAVVGARRRANGIPTIVYHCSCFQGVFNVYDAATHCNRPEKRNLRHLASLLKNGQTAGPSGRRNNPQVHICCEPPPRISGGVCQVG